MQNKSAKSIIRITCQVLIFLGVLGKFYGINDPWKIHDHYNFGGVWTTAYAECLKQTPLSVSKGIPHSDCDTPTPNYYHAHPPTILFALWGWTSIFGNAEWAYRLFTLSFSVLNILLVYRIARLCKRDELFPWLAAAFQSTFLCGLYFGTHIDFICEFTVTFVLLTAWLALKGRLTAACLAAIVAGISSWPGYITFAPLLGYALVTRKGYWRVFIFGCLGFTIALGTMMWLHQTYNIIDFFKTKLLSPGYITKKQKGWLEPIYFTKVFISSQARLLSPVLCAFAFFELIFGSGHAFWTGWRNKWANLSILHHAILLCGGTGVVYTLIGHEYVMVHVFLFVFLMPAFALLCARFTERLLQESWSSKEKSWLTFLAVLFAALYPYGVFKTEVVLDVIASAVLALSALGLAVFIWKNKKRPTWALPIFMILAFSGNMLELINYRNEPDTERSFCEKARAQYQSTGLPVETIEPQSSAKDQMYCRGIPIRYLPSNSEKK